MQEFTVKDIAEILGVSKPTIRRAINAAAVVPDRACKQTCYYSLETAAAISGKVKPAFDFMACVGCDEKQNRVKPIHEPRHNRVITASDRVTTASDRVTTASDRVTTASQPRQTASQPRQTASQPCQIASQPCQIESVAFMKMLTAIQEQLAAKDQQIAAYEAQIAFQNEQIKDYSERLKEAMQLAKGQQYLSAADKTAALIEAAEGQEQKDISELSENCHEKAPAAVPKKMNFFKKIFGMDSPRRMK